MPRFLTVIWPTSLAEAVIVRAHTGGEIAFFNKVTEAWIPVPSDDRAYDEIRRHLPTRIQERLTVPGVQAALSRPPLPHTSAPSLSAVSRPSSLPSTAPFEQWPERRGTERSMAPLLQPERPAGLFPRLGHLGGADAASQQPGGEPGKATAARSAIQSRCDVGEAARQNDPAASHDPIAAALTQRDEAMRLLMDAGADVSAPLPARLLCVYPFSRKSLQVPPFLAVLMLSRLDVLPFVTQLFARGADPHVVEPETGGNAWHFLAAGGPRDADAVGRWLHTQGVAINTRTHEGATPLGLSLMYGREIIPLLIECGADICGPQDRHRGKGVDCLTLALSNGDPRAARNIEVLIQAGVPLTEAALQEATSVRQALPLQRILERGGLSARSLDASFSRTLPRIYHILDWQRKLELLVQHGANVNIVAKPIFGGQGMRRLQKDAASACPGLLPTAALAVTGERVRALPGIRLLRDLGADLNAAGPAGSTIWHALALVQPTDAVAVAVFLRQQGVRIDRVATTADGGRVTPLAWIEANSNDADLKAVMRAAATDPAPPADALEGRQGEE
jgi:hypothetical protein